MLPMLARCASISRSICSGLFSASISLEHFLLF